MSEKKVDLTAFSMRARGFVAQGRIDDALGLYADILKIDPDNALAYADRGTAYAMLKKFELALSDLERAFMLGYVDASTYTTVATIYFEMKQFQNALKYFAKAIELNPSYPLTYYNRSSVLLELGHNKAAISDLEKCLEFSPEEDFKQLIVRRLNFLEIPQQ